MIWVLIGVTIATLFVWLWTRPPTVESTTLSVGDTAPDFELSSQTGERIRLSDLLDRGHVVLYFYVQDATPG